MARATSTTSLEQARPAELSERAPRSRRLLGRLGWPLACLALGAALAWWTRGRTLDVLIDYGGELYVAWRLREGDVLYRDLAYFTGPLSPYANALAFRLLGTGIRTLSVVNLALIAAIAALLHSLTARLGGKLAAGGATVLFLSLCAFGHLQPHGTYNFVTPYSHELVHGTLLGLATLACLARFLERPRTRWLLAMGAGAGLVALTKPELLLATAAALAAGLGAGVWIHRPRRARVAVGAAALAGAAVLPGVLAWALLARAMPAGEALGGVLGSWPHLLDGRVAALPFYRSILGTDRLGANLGAIALGAGGLGALCALALGAAFLPLRTRRARALAAASALLLVAAALYGTVATAPLEGTPDAGFERAKAWLGLARALPLVALLAACACAWRLRAARVGAEARRWALGGSWCVFALALQGKILFNVHLEHYGFALAMPALAVLALATLGWIPELAAARGGSAPIAAATGAGLFVALLAALFPLQRRNLSWQFVRVGEGADAFLADERGVFVQHALRALERDHPDARRVLVLPEGAMINYLARRRMPARHLSYMPPELLMFGEQSMLAALRASPPDVVVLVHRVTSEYGTPYFGPDYGRDLATWVQREYRPAGPPFGDPPLTPRARFGIQLLVPGKQGTPRR